jgi:hypothetical protein
MAKRTKRGILGSVYWSPPLYLRFSQQLLVCGQRLDFA